MGEIGRDFLCFRELDTSEQEARQWRAKAGRAPA
jgi:hypothetical protein